jgi:hypothetical protein
LPGGEQIRTQVLFRTIGLTFLLKEGTKQVKLLGKGLYESTSIPTTDPPIRAQNYKYQHQVGDKTVNIKMKTKMWLCLSDGLTISHKSDFNSFSNFFPERRDTYEEWCLLGCYAVWLL